ncbi:MAG: ABC transporter substrate-binding protein [Boseongicola sp.]|nr:ABC transporter substrate-binding protein [Boseongicola sp.]
MTPRRPRAVALSAKHAESRTALKWIGAAGLIAGSALAAATMARADGHEEIVVSHGYSFFGDLVYPADYAQLNYVNADAPKGGEISQWAAGTFDSFNLYTRNGRAGSLSTIGHESILTTFADDPNASYCLLCETMEYPAESLDWVIFNLRQDVTFSDGRGWTANDLAFTHNMFMTDGLPSFRAAFGAIIESVEVIDDYTIKFMFTETAPRRDVITTAGIFPAFSQSWIEETGFKLDESTLDPILGTGPYQLDSYDINRQIVYRYNENYWGADLPQNLGRNNFETIRIEYFADSSAAMEAFKAGEYTFRIENSSRGWATSYDFPGLTNGFVAKQELPDGSLGTGQSYVFNLRREKFQDPRVREAIAMMFNFEWSNESLFYGLYERTTSFWDNGGELKAVGVPTPGEIEILQPLVDEGLLDSSILTDEVVMPATSGVRQLDRRNVRAASALLDEAGWIVGDDGKRRKNGQLLTVEILDSSPAFDRIHNPFVQNLLALGIEAKLDRVDPSQETDRSRNYDFDLNVHQFSLGYEPSTGLKQYFGCEAMDESTRNLMGICTPAIDVLIENAIAAESLQDLHAAVRSLDRVLRSERFIIPQWLKNSHWVAYYDMYRYPDPLPPLALGHLDFWWHDAEAEAELRAQGAL